MEIGYYCMVGTEDFVLKFCLRKIYMYLFISSVRQAQDHLVMVMVMIAMTVKM